MRLQDYERQHVAALTKQAWAASESLPDGVVIVPSYALRPGECLICHEDAEPCEVLTDPPLCTACKGKARRR